jgi:Uma2 family endonuclease
MMKALCLTTREYDGMVARGAFDHLGKRVELIGGIIREMNPSGPAHGDLIDYLTCWSIENTRRDDVRVRVQSGISLPEFNSRPEPDITWLTPKRYMSSHPEAKDILLLIEVAESSLSVDQNDKAKLYSAAGIPEYWVVNAADECIHVYREPSPHGYRSLFTASCGTQISPIVCPTASLSLADLFDRQ